MSLSSSSIHGAGSVPSVSGVDLTETGRENLRHDGLAGVPKLALDTQRVGDYFDDLDPAQRDAIQALLRELPQATVGGDAVVNRRGAPALYTPEISFSPVDLSIRMAQLSAQQMETQTETVTDNIKATARKIEKNTASVIENQHRIAQKGVEQAKSEHLNRILGWVGRISAVIAAGTAVAVTAVGTVASGGAGLPLLALSTMALITATMSLADQVSQELGGPEITVNNLIGSMSVRLLDALGVSHEDALRISKVMVGAVAMAIPVLVLLEPQLVGTLAEGLCEMAGVSPETAQIVGTVIGVVASLTVGIVAVGAMMLATGGVGAVPIAMRLSGALVKGGAQVVQGTTLAAQGAMKVSTAATVKEASYIQAENVDLHASNLTLRKRMDSDQETLKELMKSVQDGIQAAAQILKELFDSLSQISSNMGRRAPV